jgi:DNA modification methylase
VPRTSAPGDPGPSGPKRRRSGSTSTSAFGVSKRESHDSSEFYARFSAPEVTTSEVPAAPDEVDRAIDDVFCGDSRSMNKVADRSVALVVTSPPYFAGKEYEEALGEGHVPGSYLDYLEMLTEVFAECVRTLEPGGRIAVNVANLGRRPYRSLSADVIAILQDRLRLLLRGEVIWQKQRGAAGNCAWGSFQRPGNPVLRDLSERVVIASKGRFDRAGTDRRRQQGGLPSVSSLSRDEFMDATLDVWELPAESATRVGHPAPFPVGLPERLIHLYTYVDDLVLDPFMGSGTTGVAALRTGRHFVGYDTDPDYVERARRRLDQERDDLAVGGVVSGVRLEPGRATAPERPDPLAEPVEQGWSAKDVAVAAVAGAGFTEVSDRARPGSGLDLTFSALDASGRTVWFELCGAFSSTRPGLRRADVLWRSLGKATVLSQVRPDEPLVLLTTDLPAPGSAQAAALGAALGPDRPVREVVHLRSPADLARLATLARGDAS